MHQRASGHLSLFRVVRPPSCCLLHACPKAMLACIPLRSILHCTRCACNPLGVAGVIKCMSACLTPGIHQATVAGIRCECKCVYYTSSTSRFDTHTKYPNFLTGKVPTHPERGGCWLYMSLSACSNLSCGFHRLFSAATNRSRHVSPCTRPDRNLGGIKSLVQ